MTIAYVKTRTGTTGSCPEVTDGDMKHLLQTVACEAWKMHVRTRIDLDELVSAGQLGLTQAIQSHDGRAKLATYAKHRIRGAIKDAVREHFGRHHPRIWGESIGDWEPLEECLAVYPAQGDKDTWEHLTRGLSRTQKLILSMIYRGGFSQADAARVSGYTQANICLLHKHALQFIRAKLESMHGA